MPIVEARIKNVWWQMTSERIKEKALLLVNYAVLDADACAASDGDTGSHERPDGRKESQHESLFLPGGRDPIYLAPKY